MYTESISGNLLGLIPVTFDPEHPPPLNIPLIYFTKVKVIQAGQFGGTLHRPGAAPVHDRLRPTAAEPRNTHPSGAPAGHGPSRPRPSGGRRASTAGLPDPARSIPVGSARRRHAVARGRPPVLAPHWRELDRTQILALRMIRRLLAPVRPLAPLLAEHPRHAEFQAWERLAGDLP